MEQLIILLNAIAKMSPELEAYIRKILILKKFTKEDFLVREGQISNYILFLEAGLVRIFNLDDNKEVTTWLLKEGSIFMSVASFFLQMPSFENIVALEDCVCWGISFHQLEDILLRFPEFEKHHGRILRNYYAYSEMRKFKLLGQSSLQRYITLEKEEPELLQRVPIHILATYLRMSETTFKRARRDYYGKRKGK